jgi:hypothetical protein
MGSSGNERERTIKLLNNRKSKILSQALAELTIGQFVMKCFSELDLNLLDKIRHIMHLLA